MDSETDDFILMLAEEGERAMKLDNFSLNDSFEVSAYWWLPEAPEDKVPGTLDFSPSGGAVLTLQGTFNHPDLRDIRRLFSDVGFEAE